MCLRCPIFTSTSPTASTLPAMMINPKQGGFMLKLMLAIDVVLGVACIVFLATPL